MPKEIAPVPTSALPMAALRDHLRLGTGFSDDALIDPLLEAALRAALSKAETRCGRAVLARDFAWMLPGWHLPAVLPLANVTAVGAVEVIAPDGSADAVDAERWTLIRDESFPELVGSLPAVPTGGHVRVTFTAGFGAWDDVPHDLRQAVLMLSTRFYEDRGAEEAGLPSAIAGLLAPWRRMRMGGAA